MRARPRTALVTGATRGIGAGLAKTFVDPGYNVVANALDFADSALATTPKLVLVNGNIGQPSTAMKIAEAAIMTFGSIDVVVNNAGIFFTKPFTGYTPDDFRRLSETNLEGLSLDHSACGETDAGPEDGREGDLFDLGHGSPPYRGCKSFHTNDHEGRPQGDHAEPRDGIRKRQHSLQRGRSRRGGYADARQ